MTIRRSLPLVVLVGCSRATATSPPANDASPVVSATPSTSSLASATPPVFDPASGARDVCDNAPESAPRKRALDAYAHYAIGTRTFSLPAAQVDRASCVRALLPSAIVANLYTGIPVGVSIGMSIQETGGCGGRLVEHNNFHGQKANLATSGFSHWNGDKIEIGSSESPDAGGPKIRSAFMRLSHVDYSFEAMAERLVHPDVREHRYEPCLALRSKAPAFARCIGRIWSVHVEYAEKVLHHREQWDLARCELVQSELRLTAKFAR